METAGIDDGPLFRPVNRWGQVQDRSLNPGAINDFLKTLGRTCQFDFVPELSSHSFRRGLSTSAARERIDFELIKNKVGGKATRQYGSILRRDSSSQITLRWF